MPERSQQLQFIIGAVPDPYLGRTLSELGMLKGVAPAAGMHRVSVELPTPAYPHRERLTSAIAKAVAAADPHSPAVAVDFTVKMRGKFAGGAQGLNVANVIAVGSGKGGVGKSTIAAALACGLKHFGASVGLMDADVYGPSIPHLLGARGQPAIKQIPLPDGRVMERITPIEIDGLKLMSMGFMVREDQAVIWRGPMLHKALTQFLQQTDWGSLDYLIIDMPPGTGDVAITLSQMVGLAGAVVVCTPQQVALLDAVKAVQMYRTVKIPLLGMVENMSGEIFGRGGARRKAEELGIPFLGEIPSTAVIRERGDEGRTVGLFAEENPARDPLLHMTCATAMQVARQVLESPELPTLEIL
jgi:ATP-binding protein involved in chromosome partitioning